jgi:DNA-directed RNA polymerase specialized sigma24 family protein
VEDSTETTPPFRFLPQWRGPLEGYAVKTIHKMLPRLFPTYEFDDLYQEAYTVYLLCVKRYSKAVDNPAWFMSLFKVCLKHRLIDMIKRAFKTVKTVPIEVEQITASVEQEGALNHVLGKLPAELAEMLRLFLASSKELVGIEKTLHRQTEKSLELQLVELLLADLPEDIGDDKTYPIREKIYPLRSA